MRFSEFFYSKRPRRTFHPTRRSRATRRHLCPIQFEPLEPRVLLSAQPVPLDIDMVALGSTPPVQVQQVGLNASILQVQDTAMGANAADFMGGTGDVIAGEDLNGSPKGINLKEKFGASNFGRLQFSQGLTVQDVAGDPGHLLLTDPQFGPVADLFLSDALDGEPFKDSGRFVLVPTITGTEQGFTGLLEANAETGVGTSQPDTTPTFTIDVGTGYSGTGPNRIAVAPGKGA